MAKHKKSKTTSTHKNCSCSIVGNHIVVKPTACVKGVHTKVSHAKVTKRVGLHVHTEVPAACKGLKKKARKECAKRVCIQRPGEYRTQCLKKAGIKV